MNYTITNQDIPRVRKNYRAGYKLGIAEINSNRYERHRIQDKQQLISKRLEKRANYCKHGRAAVESLLNRLLLKSFRLGYCHGVHGEQAVGQFDNVIGMNIKV